MNNLSSLFRNVWIRISIIIVFSGFSLALISLGADFLILSPLTQEIKDAKKGISKFEGEILRMERELAAIEKKMNDRKISKAEVSHYYTLYKTPVRYINNHFLNFAKPESLIIISSSVTPNTGFGGNEKELFKPYLREYGITKFKSINKVFSVVRLTLNAKGSFRDIGEYLTNLYALPVSFSVKRFELNFANDSLELNLELGIVVYRLEDS